MKERSGDTYDNNARQVYLPPEAKGLSQEQNQEERVIRRKLQTNNGKKGWEHFTPEFLDTQEPTLDREEILRNAEATRRVKIESRLSQSKAEVDIKTDLPIAVVHIGDTHIGSVFTDLKEVFRKLKKVRDTPNAYVVFMGNMIDNAIPSQFPANMLDNSINPDKQVALMRGIAEEMDKEGKVLAAVEAPCHEGWTYKHTGQDVNNLIYGFKDRNFPVMQNGGELTINVGGETYKGRLYHQMGPFESNFNKTHAPKQLSRLNMSEKPDWVAGAHRHVAATENVYEGNGEDRKQTVYIRTGTEKGTGDLHDKFTVDRSGRTGEPTGTTVHLFPLVRRILSTLGFDDGMMAHESFYLTEMAKRDAKKSRKK